MLETLRSIWRLTDLRGRILVTVGLLALTRVLAHIPMPGINLLELQSLLTTNQLFGLLNLFTGGSLENFSIILMGVGPYITASIIFQLLVIIVPSLEALQKEGEFGRKRIGQYTRLATVPLAILQGYSTIFLLRNQGVTIDLSPLNLAVVLLTLSAGTVLLMWLGELISERGIGNGISLIITLGILAGLPTTVSQVLSTRATSAVVGIGQYFDLIGFAALAVAVTAAIVVVNEAERPIPITYARSARVSGRRVASTLPLKPLLAGVIPIIFALSVMIFPPIIAQFFLQARSAWVVTTARFVEQLFQDQTFYGLGYFLAVILFTYFYTFIIFQPEQVAENLQRQSGFIPGIRPGRETAEYLHGVLNRLTLFGALFLACIAALPVIIQALTDAQALVVGGTSVLIVVSVTLETMRQLRSQLTMRRYDVL
jgi:preprotein translocase subunit SecY